jgi:hypothetical protein
MPDEHARLSPSAADRWFACPGAPNAEHGLPDTTSPAATEGTTAHALLEQSLGTRQPPAQLAGMPGVDANMIQHVTTAWRLVAGMQASCDRIALELLTDAGTVIGRDDLYGTADIVIEHGNHITVLDFKYGRWPVHPAHNKQLMIYALGAAAQALQRIESFTLGIIQPRTDGPPFTLWDIDRASLSRFGRELQASATATDDPAAPRKPGDHCRFCKARSACPQ